MYNHAVTARRCFRMEKCSTEKNAYVCRLSGDRSAWNGHGSNLRGNTDSVCRRCDGDTGGRLRRSFDRTGGKAPY